MPSYAFVSAKGSPGVTTMTAALAAVATVQSHSVLVELDPAGGSVQMLARGTATSGLVEAATQLRRDPQDIAAVRESTTELPPGVRTLLAPTAGHSAESVVRSMGSRWLPVLGLCAPVVFVDCGRWSASQRSAQRVGGADLVVVVCHPTLESVEHTRHIVQPLRETARQQVAVVVIGARPYSPEEVAHHLGAPLAGTIAWDPRNALSLWARGANRVWLRSRLARSAAMTMEGLLQAQPTAPALEAAAPVVSAIPASPVSDNGAHAEPVSGASPAPDPSWSIGTDPGPLPEAPPTVSAPDVPLPLPPPPPPPPPPSPPPTAWREGDSTDATASGTVPEAPSQGAADDPAPGGSSAERLRAASKGMWR